MRGGNNIRLKTCLAFILMLIYLSLSGSSRKKDFEIAFTSIMAGTLPSDEVSSIYQDSEGFIWIVTYSGLVRYDGYGTKLYLIANESEEYFDGYLHTVIEDDGQLLVGTERGLLCLDKISGVLKKIKDEAVDHLNVTDMVKDKEGRIWVSGDKGIFLKARDEKTFSKVDLRSGLREGGLTDIIDMLIDDKDNLWITSWHKGLYRYNINSGRLYYYNEGSLSVSYVLHQDRDGYLWIGTWGAGLLKADPRGKIDRKLPFVSYVHESDNSSSILDDIIYDIDEDSSGNLWVGSRSGLSIMKDSEFVNWYPENGFGSLPYNEVNSILRTKDNTMWLGMLGGGICKVETGYNIGARLNLENVKKEYKTNSVRSLYKIDSVSYWFGIAGYGLIRYNNCDGSFVNYIDMPEFKGFLYTSTVDDILSRKGGSEICFGSYDNGLWLYKPKTGETQVVNSTTSRLGSDSIRSLKEDNDGNIWIGTRSGAWIFDNKDSLWTLSEWLGLKHKLSDHKILDIDVDSAGNAWMATNYDGIVKADKNKGGIYSYRISGNPEVKSFNSIFVDSKGRVWAGSMWDGLYLYDKSADEFCKVEGFVFMENKAINNVSEGPEGKIWVTTNNQIVSFEYENGHFEKVWFQNISKNSKSVFFNRNASLYMPESSVMAFGSSQGVLFFPCVPEKTDSSVERAIALTGFEAGGRSIHGVNYIDKVVLKHDEGDIKIRFSLLDFVDPEGNIYRYRLVKSGKKSNKKDWMIVNGERNEALFHDLSPGNYTFEVCGARAGGFTMSQYKRLEIRILCNPWVSWRAIIGYIIFSSGSIYLIIRNIRAKIAYRRRKEYEKLNAQKTEEVDQAKLRFFTNVSHEFLTPLSIIIASVESLRPKTAADKNIVNIMSSNAIRLIRLVQQVLEFRKAESDNLKLKVSYNDAAEFVGHCVEAFLPLVRKRNLIISYESDPQSIAGWYDTDKLDKIMYNLISNAVKYTPSGGDIKVVAKRLEQDKIRITCSNSGSLMNQKTLGRLFKRFYEGDYRKFNTIGTGIGLSLVKSLVDKHKGEINVESNEKVGNSFIVTLPIGRNSYSEEEIANEANPNIPLAFSIGENIIKDNHNVLFVDDNEDLLATYSAIMSKRFNIQTCDSGQKALESIKAGKIDLVVADLMMPGMGGLDLCSEIKENVETCHIPVIILTAKKDDSSSIEGYEHGADGYLTKPCNFSVLSAMISNLIKKQENKSADFRKQLVFDVKDIDYTSMDKKFLQRAIDVVNEHIADSEFSLADFVGQMSVSRTVLAEKLKSLTGFTPAAFILNARLTLSYKLISEENDKIRVSDLAYSVGFSDAKYFSKKFKAKFGKSPKEMMDEKHKSKPVQQNY